ncbi:hypothetical protein OO013_03795 [Mangrovivirga sp. M17]|uniref:Outer membrane protein beta-barrel domain-containing protein n=1 Tax=Mangrovivirga halotolerans TaxID=2993936 RepID=A0ABT3RNZ1_9BACT|nr:hypothetical protein [Mangrovivirga halotolerans]MCX2742972.1 hypothetical protein [Mangrovivirga halotolerans]
MKPALLFLIVSVLCLETWAQDEEIEEIYRKRIDNTYHKIGGELIFQFADVERFGVDLGSPVRFSAVFHINHEWHVDFSNNFGMYFGASIRNIGMITRDEAPYSEEDNKIKRRAYTIGIPLAFKLGNFDERIFFFGGGELEVPFVYKEKLFIEGDKEAKNTEWFSGKVNPLLPSVFAGFQFPKGTSVKFKYYLNDFLDDSYSGRSFGQEDDFSSFGKSQIFYISISHMLRTRKIMREIREL